jgi:hypothetical protein
MAKPEILEPTTLTTPSYFTLTIAAEHGEETIVANNAKAAM